MGLSWRGSARRPLRRSAIEACLGPLAHRPPRSLPAPPPPVAPTRALASDPLRLVSSAAARPIHWDKLTWSFPRHPIYIINNGRRYFVCVCHILPAMSSHRRRLRLVVYINGPGVAPAPSPSQRPGLLATQNRRPTAGPPGRRRSWDRRTWPPVTPQSAQPSDRTSASRPRPGRRRGPGPGGPGGRRAWGRIASALRRLTPTSTL